jgi:hypothetical protein
MDEDLGLSERDKELRKWNAPYVYREYPRMLYRGVTKTSGLVEVEQRLVTSDGEQASLTGAGWAAHPQQAIEAEDRRAAAPGIAAAERAYRDRQMSAGAQAEAAEADGASAKHLGAIPERPKRPSRAKKTVHTE